VEPRKEHWIVAKNILIYLHGTINYGLRYASNNDVMYSCMDLLIHIGKGV
jgi:hypothetical protein